MQSVRLTLLLQGARMCICNVWSILMLLARVLIINPLQLILSYGTYFAQQASIALVCVS